MTSFNPYLNFGGKCQEALNFYKDCFQGEITEMMTYGDAKMDLPEDQLARVMHATFKADGLILMASDGRPGCEMESGGPVTLSLHHDSEAEQATVFEKLAAGGEVTMPLADTFWGARFGELTDRFGIKWMFNCQKSE